MTVDESADLDTMYSFVHHQQRERIVAEQRNALFVAIVYTRKPQQSSEGCLVLPGWFPVFDRKQVQNASDWHCHTGVVIHSPSQDEIVIPTGVSTHNLVEAARRKTGIVKTGDLPRREDLVTLNREVEKFSTDQLEGAGYSLIIPEGEIHNKLTVEDDFEGSGGVVQRRVWDASAEAEVELLQRLQPADDAELQPISIAL